MVLFYLLDADNDIYLERGEVPGMSQEAFAAADLDHDGRLSGFEFNQATFTQFETADRDRACRHVSSNSSSAASASPAPELALIGTIDIMALALQFARCRARLPRRPRSARMPASR